ncbi:hypothetical protein R1sor_013638 [Riccia sorocarpa]|uniref:K Homology domain-containing protein n=1 Tax=Riccia sorocarpa TaxID=122646 RepID=A0ABD3HA11_9MARC
MAGRYLQFSPSSASSPQLAGLRPSSAADHDKYLSELLAERQKLGPFMQVLPNCSRLLNQEIVRVTALVGNSTFLEQDGLDHGSPLASWESPHVVGNGGGADHNGWSGVGMQTDRLNISTQGSTMGWHGVPGTAGGPIIKKTQRIEVPVDKYPNFNFVGRILGPRGNSLKRVEATTGCRVLIRGRGSIKDSAKEDKMRDKPGFEHLNEPLHVLVEAELPASVIDAQLSHAREILEELLKPVDETFDLVKKAQLRELAILNGTLREDSPAYMNVQMVVPLGSEGRSLVRITSSVQMKKVQSFTM